jgi:molecular chaperone GrpE (heat shock protein)
MAELSLAAEKQAIALADSARRVSREQQAAEEERLANEEYEIKKAALDKEVEALDKSGNDYLNKLKALQDKETQLTRQHENEIAAIKDKATEQSNQSIISSYQRMVDATSRGLTQSILGHQTWAKMLTSLGDQVVSGMMENAIKSVMLDDFDKERDAAKAARKFFLAGAQLPFPANIIAAPVLAAGAFATVMAFADGTDGVPGVGRGDTVPAMLTPGEGVVPGGVMDGLRAVARNGGFDGGGTTYQVHAPLHLHVDALDASGVDKVLTKHQPIFQRHFETTLRKLNK